MTQANSEQLYDREIGMFDKITLGIVERVDDELQQLRLFIRCPGLGDYEDMLIDDLPICMMAFPFVGETIYRDDGYGVPDSSYCHGLILPPKVGSMAIVACLDNDSDQRVCLGFIAPSFFMRTFPNGRYVVKDNKLDGPYSGNEYLAAKQNDYYSKAFGPQSDSNNERITRSVDRQMSIIPEAISNEISDGVPDSSGDVTMADNSITSFYPGYQDDPNLPGGIRKAPTVYGLTTPMGNSLYMDDAVDNTKIKLRTPKGAQIILDDTNERIYVNTAEGNSWFEMDYDGNVDGFSYNLNWHATNNINLTADNNFNIKSKNVNVVATENLSTQSLKWSNQTTDYVFVAETTNATITTSTSQITTNNIRGETIQAKYDTVIISGLNMNLTGTSMIKVTGGAIHLNGPAATIASVDDPITHERTLWTSRRPDHEPWPRRSFAPTDENHTEYLFDSTDPKVGQEDILNLMSKNRNAYWRR